MPEVDAVEIPNGEGWIFQWMLNILKANDDSHVQCLVLFKVAGRSPAGPDTAEKMRGLWYPPPFP